MNQPQTIGTDTPQIVPAKKVKRKTKLQRPKDKPRPGQIGGTRPLSRTLTIAIPPAGRAGTVEEETQVQALANSLNEYQSVGVVTASGINNNVWQIVIRLASPATVTDEAALDAAFEVLVPVFNNCELLQTGFGVKKPRWRFSGQDQVDSGHF